MEHKLDKDFSALIDWSMRSLREQYPNAVLLYIPTIDYERIDQPKSPVETLVETYAAQSGIPCLNMRDCFVDHFKRTKQPAHGFYNTQPGKGHTNEVGHELIAEALADYFRREVFQQ